MRFLTLLLVLAGLSACSHAMPAPPPPPPAACPLTGYPISVGGGENKLLLQLTRTVPTLDRVLPGLLSPPGVRLLSTDRDRVLVMSGGSMHGAFGAGFFRGLPAIPQYRVVTAVSTGALQSTFIFLANQPQVRSTSPAYFRGDPLLGEPGSSYLADNALAYKIQREGDLLKVGSLSYVGAAARGSLATFAPLRASLLQLITPEVLDQVADEAINDHRSLLVGVSNLDDGIGYAIDMTKLAIMTKKETDPSIRRGYARCYAEALIASATVPPGVPPVTLTVNGQTHSFMDGGAKFGVFFQQIDAAVDKLPAIDIDLVINGKLFQGPWLNKDGTPVTRWSIVNYGLRAVDLLETEVYRFSVSDVRRWALTKGRLRVAFISGDGLQTVQGDPDEYRPRYDPKGPTCAERQVAERRTLKPQEFYPAYMRCLIDYGQARGEAQDWNPVSALNHP